MRVISNILIICIILITTGAKAEEPLGWISSGYSKYMVTPGIEACYFFRPHLGINLGVSTYIQYPDHSSITNITHDASFGFSNANLGFSGYLLMLENHRAGLITGFKIYYGPDYRKLRYYDEGGYYIYYDASSLQIDYGLDLGIFYIYKKASLLCKWDFARNRIRVGIGYRFKSD